MVGYRDRPPFGQRGGDQQQLQLGHRPEGLRPRRSAYDGKQRDEMASMAHWYDSSGQGRSGSGSAGTITVVTVASG